MRRAIACVVGILWCAISASGAPLDDIYKLGPDSQQQEGVPQGKIVGPLTLESKSVYPGTSRNYWVYVPAQYQKDKPACLMVFQDGHFFVNTTGEYRIPVVFDNLIYRREMPVTIAVFINPGRTAQQTETARFWLVGAPVAYHPFIRQLVSAKQMDVVDSASWISYKKGILAPFPDYLVNTIKANVDPVCVSSTFIGCYGATANVIACNPSIISKCPTNAQQFWDVQGYPGPRAMDAVTPDATLLFALLADGVSKDKLYPIDITKAINKLKKIKPKVQVWLTSGGQMQQVLVNKEVGIEYGWNGRIFTTLQHQIPNLQVSWDDSVVSNPTQGGLAVAKGSPNADLAFTFLNWWVQKADLQAEWTSALTYPTPNKKVNSLLTPTVLAAMPFAPNHTQPVLEDAEWTFEHQTEEEKAFQQFLTGS